MNRTRLMLVILFALGFAGCTPVDGAKVVLGGLFFVEILLVTMQGLTFALGFRGVRSRRVQATFFAVLFSLLGALTVAMAADETRKLAPTERLQVLPSFCLV